jgi:hypothetical protein
MIRSDINHTPEADLVLWLGSRCEDWNEAQSKWHFGCDSWKLQKPQQFNEIYDYFNV